MGEYCLVGAVDSYLIRLSRFIGRERPDTLAFS
jgi:hypothetical protein